MAACSRWRRPWPRARGLRRVGRGAKPSRLRRAPEAFGHSRTGQRTRLSSSAEQLEARACCGTPSSRTTRGAETATATARSGRDCGRSRGARCFRGRPCCGRTGSRSPRRPTAGGGRRVDPLAAAHQRHGGMVRPLDRGEWRRRPPLQAGPRPCLLLHRRHRCPRSSAKTVVTLGAPPSVAGPPPALRSWGHAGPGRAAACHAKPAASSRCSTSPPAGASIPSDPQASRTHRGVGQRKLRTSLRRDDRRHTVTTAVPRTR